jgi:hypothetical protein
MAALVSLIVSHFATVPPPLGCLVLCPEVAGVQLSVWGCRELARSWIGAVDRDGVWLAHARYLRRRASSADVLDNVPESHTAAHSFPGTRQESLSDVPGNRPLSLKNQITELGQLGCGWPQRCC